MAPLEVQVLVNLTGTQWRPVKDIKVHGMLGFKIEKPTLGLGV